MPKTVSEGFKEFLSRLTPTATESTKATAHRSSIEACLKSNFGPKTRFFKTGSFGNGTSITGYSDVDYFAILPGDFYTESSDYSLRKLRNALDVRFPNTGVRVSSPSVLVPFGTVRSEDTEITPADPVAVHSSGAIIYDIPDRYDGWMRSAPDVHNQYVKDVDKSLSHRVKPLIRYLKAWKYLRAVPISSFYLEMRAAKYASDETSILYPIDLLRVLRDLQSRELPAMQDPTGVSGYIHPCSTDAKREDALSKLDTAVTRIEKAIQYEDNAQPRDAIHYWRLVYDNQFPAYG